MAIVPVYSDCIYAFPRITSCLQNWHMNLHSLLGNRESHSHIVWLAQIPTKVFKTPLSPSSLLLSSTIPFFIPHYFFPITSTSPTTMIEHHVVKAITSTTAAVLSVTKPATQVVSGDPLNKSHQNLVCPCLCHGYTSRVVNEPELVEVTAALAGNILFQLLFVEGGLFSCFPLVVFRDDSFAITITIADSLLTNPISVLPSQ